MQWSTGVVAPTDGFYAKENKASPTTIHFKDYGGMAACNGFNTDWVDS